MATAGLLPVALSFGLNTRAYSALAVHLTWGLLGGLGTGMVGRVLGVTVTTCGFVRQRGVVVGMFGAGAIRPA
ncbi:hypothetical protein [Deinococcus sp.]|uniref:hypothetical protein n=1 Tax=Deinococcus sp. TaxID=47478 RepID=UPI0028699C33|nr:hypothetical protein [Deinococcus sp.]